MEQWLTELAAEHPNWADLAWSTKRRIAIKRRWPDSAQNEAIQDHLNSRTADDGGRWEAMQADITAIKAAIPKD